jgi:N-acetyl sugar amidotransferase
VKNNYGLPEQVIFCRRCVISNQRPSSSIEFLSDNGTSKNGININDNGICDACAYQDQKANSIDWHFRENQLRDLAQKIRSERTDSKYDIIVPGSGGKDSAYTAHILKYEYGLNPLTVTWAPHLYTEIGWRNFTNWIHVGGFDNLLFTPNGRLHRILTRLAFTELLHPFQPFIMGQRIIGPKIAKQFGIRHIFYGENQAEYGNSISENAVPVMNNRFYANSNLNQIKFGGRSIAQIMNEFDFDLKDFSPYLPLQENEAKGLEVHYLGYYLKWDPQECFYYAFANTGFVPNEQRTEGSFSKYSSIDDKIDPFHYYTTLVKFGLGRASYDAAQEIRNGKITRQEGISLVRKYDSEFPSKYFRDFLEYIGINEEEFHQTIDRYRPNHIWIQRNNKWELRHPVWADT